MNRRALIISNPGEEGSENYCRGVFRDVVNYRTFLLSPNGGLWRESEIIELDRPSTSKVRQTIEGLPAYDYVLVIFSGHGCHSTNLDSTIVELRVGHEIDSAEFRLDGTKESIILDCCRKKTTSVRMTEARDSSIFAKAGPAINPDQCRMYYNKRIEDCPEALIVMYSCGIDELSIDDDQRGGMYSYRLLEVSKNWARNSTIDTSKHYDIYSVVAAHEATIPLVGQLSSTRQTPHIEKPRSGPYFPFCIVA